MRIIFSLFFTISFILFNLFFLSKNNILSLISYFLYLCVFIIFLVNPKGDLITTIKSKFKLKLNRDEILILGIIIFAYLSLLFYFSTFKFHYQEDEFITGYISFFLPSLNKLNWFALFPLDKSWVTQIPILFFIFQKLFFVVFGPSLETIRISTWPYQIFTVIFMYLIAKEYFREKIYQYLVPVIFITLAPNLYLSSLGLHFISSTAFFLASIYFFLRMMKESNMLNAVFCGIFIGASYLTYASSYSALPILILFMFFELIKSRSLKPLRSFIISVSVFLLILYPFLLEIVLGNNFLVTRVNQVSIFQPGTSNWIPVLTNSLFFNLRAIYTAGIGGVNEYYFGNQALFNSFTLLLIILGSIFFLWHIVKSNIRFSYPLIIIVFTFFLGMVLTIPAGAFHRIYISFPFVALIIVGAIKSFTARIESLKIIPKSSAWLFLTFVIIFFSVSNFYSTKTMIDNDGKISILTDSVYIDSYIKSNFPVKSKIYIAAYPAYHLGKELFFRTNGKYNINTNYFSLTLPLLKKNDLLIIQYPTDDEVSQLFNKFKNGIYLSSLENYNFKYDTVFVPK